MEQLALEGAKRGWKLAFYGPFWEGRNTLETYLKRKRFQMGHSILAAYVHNGRYTPGETAGIYARSKICLNIDGNARAHFNPRTYDILATGSFQLMDRHSAFQDTLVEGRDYVAYETIDDLLFKCNYYLAHEEERERIAVQGYENGKEVSMKNTLRRILE